MFANMKPLADEFLSFKTSSYDYPPLSNLTQKHRLNHHMINLLLLHIIVTQKLFQSETNFPFIGG